MLKSKKLLAFAITLILVLSAFTACGSKEPAPEPSKEEGPAEIIGTIILATTTSTQDSGLLDVILPDFTYKTGYEVDVIA